MTVFVRSLWNIKISEIRLKRVAMYVNDISVFYLYTCALRNTRTTYKRSADHKEDTVRTKDNVKGRILDIEARHKVSG